MKKTIAFILTAVAALLLLNACGSTEGSAVILADGQQVDSIELMYDTQSPVLTAEISGGKKNLQTQWASDDAGVVRVNTSEDGSCTLETKKTGTVKISVTAGDISAVIKVRVVKNPYSLTANDIALTVGSTDFSVEQLNIYYVDEYTDFMNDYGSYAEYYGIDTSRGISGLSDCSCDYSGDGTWRGYFLEASESAAAKCVALCAYARQQGIELNTEEQAEITDAVESLKVTATQSGYDDLTSYLQDLYGEGINEELYVDHLTNKAVASKVYTQFYESLSFSQEELSAHYETLGYEYANDYPVVAMRHVLISAEDDGNGGHTDEAIASAHERAEELYEQWLSGDATEESFAQLANDYSEDPGSNTVGGLYENIYQNEMVEGINEWLFASGRKVGDTAVIDNNGSYVGTHIVYFVSTGELYCDYLSRTDLETAAVSSLLDELSADITAAEGKAISKVGIFE